MSLNKTPIEYCDYTYNPITGCLNGCPYCFARRIAERFGRCRIEACRYLSMSKILDLEGPLLKTTKQGKNTIAPYPFGFTPTFHRYRLGEPARLKKPSRIFVGSMSDMFGEWVPDEWIKKVLEDCWKAPHHKYLLLTKNPSRYVKLWQKMPVYTVLMLNNTISGATITCQKDIDNFDETTRGHINFYSVEPLLGTINMYNALIKCSLRWVIVGAQTGPGAVKPQVEWVQSIVEQCRAANVPVFLKGNLKGIWEGELIQEYPDGMK